LAERMTIGPTDAGNGELQKAYRFAGSSSATTPVFPILRATRSIRPRII